MIAQLFDKAPCGFFSFYDDGTIMQVNETLGTILKVDTETLKGKNVESLFTLPTKIFCQTHFFPLLQIQGHAEEIFLTLLSSDGEYLPVLLNAKRMEWEQRMITNCVFIVVPNRKKFEDELVAARKTAENALSQNTDLVAIKAALQDHTKKLEHQMRLVNNQNQELQQFSHVVTHNLKEPLRKILLYTEKLQGETQLPTIDKLARSARQMKAVVTGLQQYVWLNDKANKYQPVNLDTIVQNAVSRLTKEHDAHLLNLQKDELGNLEGDEEQLELMFFHLLDNAVKFRKGEQANVAIKQTILKQNVFKQVAGKYDYQSFLKLELSDEGIGFDPEYKNHIFELFRKLHSGEGQGLGLALCKKIVGNHAGHIEADGKPGISTTITIWLPLQQAASGMQETLPGMFNQ